MTRTQSISIFPCSLSSSFLFMVSLIWCLFGGELNKVAAHEDSAYYYDDGPVTTDYGDWMNSLADDSTVTGISIPGTHDSLALCKSGTVCHHIFPEIVRCQRMTLREQLISGIRFLDIRIKSDTPTGFGIFHGPVYQEYRLQGDVLQVLNDFLQEFPSETVLMRLKDEEENNLDDKVDVLVSTLERFSGIMIPKTCYSSIRDVKLGDGSARCDARGKFIVLQNGYNLPNTVSFFHDNHSAGDIQDKYDASTNWDLVTTKWNEVKDHMNKAAEGPSNKLYFNYMNMSSGGFPYFFASGHVSQGTGASRLSTGWVTSYDSGDPCGYSVPKATCNGKWPDFPRTERFCLFGGCLATISFEGVPRLVMNYLDEVKDLDEDKAPADKLWPLRLGVMVADFPGKGFMTSVINSNYDRTGAFMSIGEIVQNNPPVAKLDKDLYTIDEGSLVIFDAGGSSDPDGDNLSFDWDLTSIPSCVRDEGDGKYIREYFDKLNDAISDDMTEEEQQQALEELWSRPENKKLLDRIDNEAKIQDTARYTCGDNNDGIIRVTATDAYDEDTAEARVIVRNVAPKTEASFVSNASEGEVSLLQIKIIDPGTLDTFDVTVDWGDGSPIHTRNAGPAAAGEQSISLLHTYTGSDLYTVAVGCTDSDGGTAEITRTTIEVANVDPISTLEPVTNELGERMNEDVQFTFTGLQLNFCLKYSDAGMEDTHLVMFDWGDGKDISTHSNLLPFTYHVKDSHTYDTPGEVMVRTTVTDDDGGIAKSNVTLQIHDACDGIREIRQDLLALIRDIALSTEAPTPSPTAKKGAKSSSSFHGSVDSSGSSKSKSYALSTCYDQDLLALIQDIALSTEVPTPSPTAKKGANSSLSVHRSVDSRKSSKSSKTKSYAPSTCHGLQHLQQAVTHLETTYPVTKRKGKASKSEGAIPMCDRGKRDMELKKFYFLSAVKDIRGSIKYLQRAVIELPDFGDGILILARQLLLATKSVAIEIQVDAMDLLEDGETDEVNLNTFLNSGYLLSNGDWLRYDFINDAAEKYEEGLRIVHWNAY